MTWSIAVKGTRSQVQEAVNNNVDCPDSVKGFVANATAYYTDETILDFHSDGHAPEPGLILDCGITLKVISLGTEKPEKPPATDKPPEATQLPADTKPGKGSTGPHVEPVEG
jgi:hypothetical protein